MVGFAAVVPTALYLLWSAALGGQETRTLAYHPTHASEIVDSFGRFLLPPSWPTGAPRRSASPSSRSWSRLPASGYPDVCASSGNEDRVRVQQLIAIVFIVLYVATVFATQTWLDRSTAFDARLFAPVRGVVYAVTVAVGYRLLAPYLRRKGGRDGCRAALRGARVHRVVDRADGDRHGRGTEHRCAQPRKKRVAGLRDDAIIVTNVPDIVYLASGRRSFVLPSPLVYSTGKREPRVRSRAVRLGPPTHHAAQLRVLRDDSLPHGELCRPRPTFAGTCRSGSSSSPATSRSMRSCAPGNRTRVRAVVSARA